ncbi:MAG: hypothetical protein EXR66_08060 [Dehalococcoidia bacterium]|nr:hypothetical protein [Dehalococcoidia bacterium]
MATESEVALLASTIDRSTAYVKLLIESAWLTDGSATLTSASTLLIRDQIALQHGSAVRLVELSPGDVEMRQFQALTESKEEAFRHYVQSGNPDDFAAVNRIHIQIGSLAERVAARSAGELRNEAAQSDQIAELARLAVVGAAAVVVGVLTITTTLISRRLRSMLDRSEAAHESLEQTAASIERRNVQFRRLYEVADGSGDDLDITSIAVAAVQAGRRLSGANLAVLWLMQRDGQLELGFRQP